MLICKSCFVDEEIAILIMADDHIGTCDVCRSQDYVYDTEANSILQDTFSNLIKVYLPKNQLPDQFPPSGTRMLVDELSDNWSIFSTRLNRAQISKILNEIVESSELDESYMSDPVGIPELYDHAYLLENSILGDHTWDDFKNNVKYQNRYFSNYLNSEITEKILSYLVETIQPDHQYYRARINKDGSEYKIAEMGAPLPNDSAAGRINAAGIRCLYLADSVETCIHEIRASEFDNISVATFQCNMPLQFINLGAITKISPFLPEYVEPKVIAVNRVFFQEIDQEISKVTRKDIPHIEYVPTQCFADLIKNFGNQEYKISGIIFNSVMNTAGFNVASFYPEDFSGSTVKVYRIENLSYKYTEVK